MDELIQSVAAHVVEWAVGRNLEFAPGGGLFSHMDFEWDEEKRRQNIAIRGVDFARAVLVFDDPARQTTTDARQDYGEVRRRTIGRIDDETYVVIYTMRGATLRVIAAWSLGRNAKRRYQTI